LELFHALIALDILPNSLIPFCVCLSVYGVVGVIFVIGRVMGGK
jgi:hypothetical protein